MCVPMFNILITQRNRLVTLGYRGIKFAVNCDEPVMRVSKYCKQDGYTVNNDLPVHIESMNI